MTTLTFGTATAGQNRPLIAVPVTGTTISAVLGQVEQINESRADVIEWRVDYLTDLVNLRAADVQTILFNADKPVIFTWRTAAEGGQRPFDIALYELVYRLAIKTGVAAIDIEHQLFTQVADLVADAHTAQVPIINSQHFFADTPMNLDQVFGQALMTAADVIKVATMPQTDADVDRLLATTQQFATEGKPLITMAMGELGQRTRTIGGRNGSQLTFATLGAASAPGQLDLATLLTLLED